MENSCYVTDSIFSTQHLQLNWTNVDDLIVKYISYVL